MKVVNLNLNIQRNASHYQFQTDFNTTVIRYTPQALGIVDTYAAYLPHYVNEGVAFVAITKSATTDEIEIWDKSRDFCFRGLSDKVMNSLNHFDPEVRAAAKRAKVIFDTYGNLAPKPNDEESGLIKGLITDLRTKIPADLITLEIVEWIAELERLENEYLALQNARDSEAAHRSDLRMKNERMEVDAAYRTIITRINALIIVNGEAAYTEFVRELNARIERAQDAIANSGTQPVQVPA